MKLFKANRSLDVAALWYPGTNCIFVKKLSPSINLQHTESHDQQNYKRRRRIAAPYLTNGIENGNSRWYKNTRMKRGKLNVTITLCCAQQERACIPTQTHPHTRCW